MDEVSRIRAVILDAFRDVPFPGNENLVAHLGGGNEPLLVKEAFQDKDDWRLLPADFLDEVPDGFASALIFLSDAAFQFYLPAYLLADLDRQMRRASPMYHLCRNFDNESRLTTVDGKLTWFEYGQSRCASFSQEQVHAIIAFLEFKRRPEYEDWMGTYIDEALANYWRTRT